MADLRVLAGKNLIDPAHVGNTTGRWICDGLTAHDWARQGQRMAEQHTAGWEEAMAISGALQAYDNYDDETLHP